MKTLMLIRAGLVASIVLSVLAVVMLIREQRKPDVTPNNVWRAALHECRYQREVEACKVEKSDDCEIVRMANAADYLNRQDIVEELSRCLDAGAGLHLQAGVLR